MENNMTTLKNKTALSLREKLVVSLGLTVSLAALLFLLLIEHFPIQVFHVAGIYLWTAMLLSALATIYGFKELRKEIFILPLVMGGIATYSCFMTYALVLLINFYLPPQHSIVYQGSIIEKQMKPRSGREAFDDHYIVLDSMDEYGFPLRFYVSRHRFHRLKVGMKYRYSMTRGGLGLAYRWIHQ